MAIPFLLLQRLDDLTEVEPTVIARALGNLRAAGLADLDDIHAATKSKR